MKFLERFDTGIVKKSKKVPVLGEKISCNKNVYSSNNQWRILGEGG